MRSALGVAEACTGENAPGAGVGMPGLPRTPLGHQFLHPFLGRVDLSPEPLQGRSVLPIPEELIDPIMWPYTGYAPPGHLLYLFLVLH